MAATRGGRWLAALALAALLTGCGGPATTGAATDIEWRERQTLFRLLPQPLRLEAYALRGGIAPLGSVRLPAGVCPRALALDAAAGRLWLSHEHGSIEIDARSLHIVADAGVPRAGEQGAAASASARRVAPAVCEWGGVLAQSTPR